MSSWFLRTAVFGAAVCAGLLLANWTRPVAMNAPEAASLLAHLQVSTLPAVQPTTTPTASLELRSAVPAARHTAAASPIPGTRTPEPALTVPLASVPQTQIVSGMELTLIISPGNAGANDIELFFFDPDGTWASVTTVEVRLHLLESPVQALVLTVEPLHPGHAYFSGADMRHAGIWQIDVRLDGIRASGTTGSFRFLLP